MSEEKCVHGYPVAWCAHMCHGRPASGLEEVLSAPVPLGEEAGGEVVRVYVRRGREWVTFGEGEGSVSVPLRGEVRERLYAALQQEARRLLAKHFGGDT